MTSRERLWCALRGGRPDRVPVSPFGWGHVSPDSDLGAEMLARLDMLVPVGAGGGDPFWGTAVEMTHEQHGADSILTVHTPSGDLRQVHRRTPITSATVEFLCHTADDLRRVMALPYTPPDPTTEAYDTWVARAGDEALVLVGMPNAICWPATLMSPADLCLAWADAPGVLCDLCDLANERLLAWTEALCRRGVRAFRIVGGEYATTQLGPAGFRALCLAQDRALCDLLRRFDALSYYHNHGPVMRFLDLFGEVGMDAIDPLEGPPYGDCDLRATRSRLPGIGLVGNLDDMEQLEQWPLARLQALARERLAESGRVGVVLGGTASGTYTERGGRGFLGLLDVVG